MQGGKEIWKEIWTAKYSMPTTPEEILRKKEVPRGLAIWELASQNRDIVDENIFWEIRKGQTTRFWEEPWQQREKLLDLQENMGHLQGRNSKRIHLGQRLLERRTRK